MIQSLQHRLVASALAACLVSYELPKADASGMRMSDSVERVVDGDTVVLSGLGKSRLIGMNTPETVAPAQRSGAPPQCYGVEASARTKSLLPQGSRVEVEFDKEPQDKFGRSLVYLYTSDGTQVNSALVRDGYARAKAYAPNTLFKSEFKALEDEAKSKQRGLWGACADAAPTAGKGFDRSRPAVAATGVSEGKLARPARTPAEVRLLQQQQQVSASPALQNPGDTKNCADFSSYAEAKAWFDTYFVAFGDVAKLDGNGDGRPCESLLKLAK